VEHLTYVSPLIVATFNSDSVTVSSRLLRRVDSSILRNHSNHKTLSVLPFRLALSLITSLLNIWVNSVLFSFGENRKIFCWNQQFCSAGLETRQ